MTSQRSSPSLQVSSAQLPPMSGAHGPCKPVGWCRKGRSTLSGAPRVSPKARSPAHNRAALGQLLRASAPVPRSMEWSGSLRGPACASAACPAQGLQRPAGPVGAEHKCLCFSTSAPTLYPEAQEVRRRAHQGHRPRSERGS